MPLIFWQNVLTIFFVSFSGGRSIIFTETKESASQLAGLLPGARALHGDIQQAQREVKCRLYQSLQNISEIQLINVWIMNFPTAGGLAFQVYHFLAPNWFCYAHASLKSFLILSGYTVWVQEWQVHDFSSNKCCSSRFGH